MNDLLASLTCPKWRRRKEARPGELVDAALGLFVERGFAATRLEDVAASAGVSKGTVCSYFPTKEALFAAVVRQNLLPTIAHQQQLGAEPGTAADALRRIARYKAQMLDDPRLSPLPKLIMSEVGHFPELARLFIDEVCHPSNQLLAGIIQRGIDGGEFRPVEPHLHAHLLMAPLLFHAIWRHSLGRHDTICVETTVFVESHLDVFLRGIAAQAIAT